MRLVVDTNVFVSVLIRPGEALSAFVDYLDRYCTLLYSTETLIELVDTLHRRKFAKYTDLAEVAAFVRWVVSTGELVLVERTMAISRDSKDDKFLAVAIEGRADYLISGDKDLLVLGQIGTIPIIAPSAFLNALKN